MSLARSAISRSLRAASKQRQQLPQTSACVTCHFARSYATPAASPSTSSATPPAPSSSTSSSTSATSPKVQQIVDQIAGLSLLEASELVSTLKSRLNIADVAVAAPVAAAPGAGSGAAAAPAAEAEPEKPKEKTVFTVTLTKIDAAQKAKVIKEVKNVMPTMNLVEAKKFVESVPKTLKENVPKDDIEKMKKAFEAVGASLEVS